MATAQKLLADFIAAYDSHNVELNSPEIQAGDEAPYPWHEEWLSYARTAAVEQVRASKWQPIKTAPKDGTRVILSSANIVVTGFWSPSSSVWLCDWSAGNGDPKEKPTHWQPLPEPPQAITSPKRIQRKRTKGWRMPPNTVSVTRPGRWGNPFKVGTWVRPLGGLPVELKTAEQAVALFRANAMDPIAGHVFRENVKMTLRGKDLACYCALDGPCHADVLLEIANK